MAAWVSAIAFLTVTVLSWWLTLRLAIVPVRKDRATVFARLAVERGWETLAAAFGAWNTPGPSPEMLAAIYSAPFLVATAASVWLLRTSWRDQDALTQAHVDRAWRAAACFALLLVPAAPVAVDDFWLSVTWGRALAAGINPYYAVPAWATDSVPVGGTTLTMSYGPLWAHVSATLMWLARDSVFWGALFFKILLAAFWLIMLGAVRVLVRRHEPFAQIFACVLLGWLPLGVTQAIAEGHNDVVMMALAMLWLVLHRRGAPVAAAVALAGSVLVKYVTAPLFALHAIRALAAPHGRQWRELSIAAAVVTLGSIVATAPLFRGLDFFASSIAVDSGHFFRPHDAVYGIEQLTGWPLWAVRQAVRAAFPVLAVYAAYRLWRRPNDDEGLATATAAGMLAVTMSGVAHMWPWYVLWLTAPAALVPGTWLARWAFGVTAAMPYPMAIWSAQPGTPDVLGLGIAAYTAVLAIAVALRAWTPMSRERRGRDLKS